MITEPLASPWSAPKFALLFLPQRQCKDDCTCSDRHVGDIEYGPAYIADTDIEEVDKYDASPWSGFTCTTGFYQDLMAGLSLIHTKGALSGLPLNLPVLMASAARLLESLPHLTFILPVARSLEASGHGP